MKPCVILSLDEWNRLPAMIADALREHSEKGYGFTFVSREDGKPVVDRLDDWLRGTMTIVMADVRKRMEKGGE